MVPDGGRTLLLAVSVLTPHSLLVSETSVTNMSEELLRLGTGGMIQI